MIIPRGSTDSRLLCSGRLNVLANVVRKPMRQIFSEFGGVMPAGEYYGTGDVKYHLGTSYDRPTISGKQVHLSLLANPSHLEVHAPLSPMKACMCVDMGVESSTVLAWVASLGQHSCGRFYALIWD